MPRRSAGVQKIALLTTVLRRTVASRAGLSAHRPHATWAPGGCAPTPLKAQGLELPTEALRAVAGIPYSAGVPPFLPLLPLITDRHVNALTLAGTVEEVTDQVVALFRAGIDGTIIRPIAAVRSKSDPRLWLPSLVAGDPQ
ncbi:MAG: hypothetical protein JO320_02890 [Alphaproteobacteria bacterium]|nr:hypothetical protein [Alphaproteobacteria bacterium]MBV9374001.1 hypothetical protein [Alphaproteobacteria bacterium]